MATTTMTPPALPRPDDDPEVRRLLEEQARLTREFDEAEAQLTAASARLDAAVAEELAALRSGDRAAMARCQAETTAADAPVKTLRRRRKALAQLLADLEADVAIARRAAQARCRPAWVAERSRRQTAVATAHAAWLAAVAELERFERDMGKVFEDPAGGRLVSLRVLKKATADGRVQVGPFNAGELAGFPADEAARLVRAGLAEPVEAWRAAVLEAPGEGGQRT